MTFFRSRWVEKPEHVKELEPDALPKCFCSAGVAAGIKPKGLDVGVLASFDESTSAARFTTNARVGAPVIASKEARLDGLRAVVANSGCSNVGDGERGLETARAMQRAVAEELELEPDQVGVASTGVIGLELPREKVVSGARAACGAPVEGRGRLLGGDPHERRRAEARLPRGRRCRRAPSVRLAAQAKGAGMISPRYATMFCFVQTDAGLDAETLDLLTGVCVKRSFDRISVDGQLSTSDTVFAIANGASDVRIEPQTPDELAFGEAMDALLRQLALEIVHDGEGCERVGRIVVQGDGEIVEPVARSVADSPLVKTALHGGDPNFGRILQAAGKAFPPGAPFVVDLAIEGRQLVSAGDAIDIGPDELAELEKAMQRRRDRVRPDAAGRGRRDRGVLQRPFGGVRDLQRDLHVMRDVETLLEALPYIRAFDGQTVVIKYGGAAMTDDTLKEDFARDVVLLKYVGMNPIVVHGGGPDITSYMERLGMEVKFHEGLRVSDEATVEVAKMVLVGKQNKDIVLRLNRHGQPAVGICGDDGQLFRVRKAAMDVDIGFVGEIENVDVDVLNHIAQDYIPVIASVGADEEGNSYNVNADTAAGAIAEAMGAFKVIFLTDVEAWLDEKGERISQATAAEVTRAAAAGERRHAAEARGVRARARRRGRERAHHRRAEAALAAARALHGRGDRDEALALDEPPGARARVRDGHVRAQPGRVRARRGLTRLWDDEGNEYLDFLAGISVAQIGHAHPDVGRGGVAAGRAARARGEPLLHGARDAAGGAAVEAVARREGVLHELGRRGDRVRDQARAQAQAGGRGRRARGRVPRAHLRRAVGHAAGGEAGAVLSIRLWQLAQAALARCSASRSRTERVAATVLSFSGRHVRRRRRRRRAEDVFQNPLAANHRRRARGIRRDREDAALPQQAAALAVPVQRDAPEVAAVHVRNAVVLREPLVQERVVGLEQVEHAAVFAQDALEKQLGFAAERLAQVVVEIGKQPQVGRDRFEVAQVQPLLGEVADERSRARDRRASAAPASRAPRACAARRARRRRAVRRPGCCSRGRTTAATPAPDR